MAEVDGRSDLATPRPIKARRSVTFWVGILFLVDALLSAAILPLAGVLVYIPFTFFPLFALQPLALLVLAAMFLEGLSGRIWRPLALVPLLLVGGYYSLATAQRVAVAYADRQASSEVSGSFASAAAIGAVDIWVDNPVDFLRDFEVPSVYGRGFGQNVAKYYFLDPQFCRRARLEVDRRKDYTKDGWLYWGLVYDDRNSGPMVSRDECVLQVPGTLPASLSGISVSDFPKGYGRRATFWPQKTKIIADGKVRTTWSGSVVKMMPWKPDPTCSFCYDFWQFHRMITADDRSSGSAGLLAPRKNGVAHAMDREISDFLIAASAPEDMKARAYIERYLAAPEHRDTERFLSALWRVPDALVGKASGLFTRYKEIAFSDAPGAGYEQRFLAAALLAASDAEFATVSEDVARLLISDGRTGFAGFEQLYVRAAKPGAASSEAYVDAYMRWATNPSRHMIEALCRVGKLPDKVARRVRGDAFASAFSREQRHLTAYIVLVLNGGDINAAAELRSMLRTNDRKLDRKLDAILRGEANTPFGPNNCLDPSEHDNDREANLLNNRSMIQVFR